ncbi:cingulin isoform X1 [Micropterus salmoides]|uniref:cingulin isoform X1 n=1 Tax=Micropterus salmoides TaxID=27706 RepID=UPI0018EBBDCA|nr:cingulin isoform X1 [Micropterus salmoides]XP_038567355.1 cingulin isoform X1 [Micropterus salmoides]XP_038567356.1 cingulin isoform X1 [Micropterus salmoides]
MSTPSSGRKTPVDCGVQIRFINDLYETGGSQPGPQPKTKTPTSKYGVAVRVQGIAGQPYVVLKDGKKGDSYGVQLRTQYPSGHTSLPRRREKAESGMQGGDVEGGRGQGGALRRAQSHGSLLDRDGEGGAGNEDFQLSRPPGDGKSGSYGNLDGGIGVRGEKEQVWHVGGREGDMESNMWGGSYKAGLNGSMRISQSYSDPPQQTNELHPNQRQTPVNRLINRFDGGNTGGQQRGLASAHQDPRATSPLLTHNTYTSPLPSSHSSLGPNQAAVATFPGHPANQWTSPGRYAAVETQQASLTEAKVTPDLLLDQGQSAEMSSEEEQVMQTIYNILRQGTNESDVVIKHKVKVIFQKIQNLKPKERPHEEWVREKRELERKIAELQTALQEERRDSVSNSDPALKAELESCLDENLQLQEMLDRKKKELNDTQSELTQLRMDRENAEARVREMEDHLAELQDELRRENGNKTDLMSYQTQLMEVCQLKQKLEETLRQRERELTALKGALKEEVASHDKEIEVLREQYSADMEKLRSSMEQVSQSHAGIEAERLRVNASVRSLQQQLEDCRDESSHWMEQFHATRDELRTTKQELLQTRLEKEDIEEELKELQEKVSTMKHQLPDPNHTQTLNQELQRCSADLQKAKSELEKQRTEFDKKVMEVISIKKSHQNQEAELKYEIDRLKDQLQRAREDCAKAQDKNKRLPDPAIISELEQKLDETRSEASRLKETLSLAEEELEASKTRLSRAQMDVKSLQDAKQEQEEANTRLKDKLSRLESQLQASATESSEAELALHTEVRGLRAELDEAKRKASRLSQEHSELSLRLEDTEKDKETLKQTISQLEETKRQQERALEKLNKDYESLTVSSREEAQALRVQQEEQRERARKEMQEAQRHGNNAQSELERSHTNLRRLEEEMSRQKKELLLVCEERDNHQLDKELLTNRLRHLEGEIEASKNSHNEKTREIRILEDKLKRLELELDEEKNSVEMLTDRVARSRDQIDQLRSELMQERSSKQDLELDKNAMERHLKELRSRVADMEGQSRSSAGVSQLENKIQELEDHLRNEEREKTSLLASQRRLERKLKELNMTLDEERQTHTEQRDQLALRVKALKRQVDEGETELERIDGMRRKAQRDMEEQMELKEALQNRVTALETDLKRKTQAAMRPLLDSSVLSSDDDDSVYDPSTITSILTESNLQTSSC